MLKNPKIYSSKKATMYEFKNLEFFIDNFNQEKLPYDLKSNSVKKKDLKKNSLTFQNEKFIKNLNKNIISPKNNFLIKKSSSIGNKLLLKLASNINNEEKIKNPDPSFFKNFKLNSFHNINTMNFIEDENTSFSVNKILNNFLI